MEVVEIYKDIKGYNGLYQVSNLGNIRSLSREYINARGQRRTVKGSVLKLNKKRTGYLEVSLSIQGEKQKHYLVHKLVANNFIDNPDCKRNVNHIDGNKENNRVDNLEWCTNSENQQHAYKNNLNGWKDSIHENLRLINEKTSYNKVIMKKNNDIIEFNSISAAADKLGLKRDNITRAIRKGQKVGGWEVFGYKKANEEILEKQDNLVGK